MNVAILGAGNGGASAVVELGQMGFRTRLWNRSQAALAAFQEKGGIKYTGVLGEGFAKPEMMTTDLSEVLTDADVILICLPTLAHSSLAEELVKLGINRIPVILNPGHTGGALEFVETFNRRNMTPPVIAEFSTLTYVARKPQADSVFISSAAKHVWLASMPGSKLAIDIATKLYPRAELATDVLATGLANVNMVLHTPTAILGAAWVETSGGNFTFYVEGLPDGVGRIMEALDRERLAVAAAFGHKLPDLFTEMQSIGTIEAGSKAKDGLAAAVRSGKANSKIRAPESLNHRYYREDFWYGIKPFLMLADIAQVDVPIARSLMSIAKVLVGGTVNIEGRSAAAMGIVGMNKQELIRYVRE